MSDLVNKKLIDNTENEIIHIPYSYEQKLMSAICYGDLEEVYALTKNPSKGIINVYSKDSLRQIRYQVMVYISLIARATIEYGLPEEIAYSIVDAYGPRIDACESREEAIGLSYDVISDFVQEVRSCHLYERRSKVVTDCLTYIQANLHTRITLEDLARYCGVCSKTVSAKFKKEIGKSITDYIHQMKVNEAEYLLKTEKYSVSEVSALLAFSSQSYFANVFYKYKGKLPKELL